jgi:hypothetical protein
MIFYFPVILVLVKLGDALPASWPWEATKTPKLYPWEDAPKVTMYNAVSNSKMEGQTLDAMTTCSNLDYWKDLFGYGAVETNGFLPYYPEMLANPYALHDLKGEGTAPLYSVKAHIVEMLTLSPILKQLSVKHTTSLIVIKTNYFVVDETDLEASNVECNGGTIQVFNRLVLPSNVKLYLIAATYQTMSFETGSCRPVPHVISGEVHLQLGTIKGWQIKLETPTASLIYSDNLKVAVPETHMLYLWFSCARRLAGYNMRTSAREEAHLAWRIARLISMSQTTELQLKTLVTKASDLEGKLNRLFGFQKTASMRQVEFSTGTFVQFAANITVPEWTTSVFKDRLERIAIPITDYVNKLKDTVQSTELTSGVRKQYLLVLAEIMSRSGQDYKFEVTQSLNSVKAYNDSANVLQGQTATAREACKAAKVKFEAGIAQKKLIGGVEVAAGFLSALVETAVGAVTNWGGLITGLSDLLGARIEAAKFANAMKSLDDAVASLNSLEKLDIVLPNDPAQISDYLNQVLAASKDDATAQKMREDLLTLSKFDRSAVEDGIAQYEMMGGTVRTLMQRAKDQLIDGAMDVDVAYSNFAIVERAYMTARLNYYKAKIEYALSLDTVLTSFRKAQVFTDTTADLEGVEGRKRAVILSIPGYVNVYTQLLDVVSQMCDAYMYAEGKDVPPLPTSDLVPYSLDIATFELQRVEFVTKLERSMDPRQNWKVIVDFNAESRVVKNLKMMGTAIVPAAHMLSSRDLNVFSAVCLLECGVEVVGAAAKGSEKDVTFLVDTSGVNVRQRKTNGELETFSTASTSIQGTYQLGDEHKSETHGIMWMVEPRIVDAANRFCRTPFQDFILTHGGTVNLSQMTSIKLAIVTKMLVKRDTDVEKRLEKPVEGKIWTTRAAPIDLYVGMLRCDGSEYCKNWTLSRSKTFELIGSTDDVYYVQSSKRQVSKCETSIMSICEPIFEGGHVYEAIVANGAVYIAHMNGLTECNAKRCRLLSKRVVFTVNAAPDATTILYTCAESEFAVRHFFGKCTSSSCNDQYYEIEVLDRIFGIIGDDVLFVTTPRNVTERYPFSWHLLKWKGNVASVAGSSFSIPQKYHDFPTRRILGDKLYLSASTYTKFPTEATMSDAIYQCSLYNPAMPDCKLAFNVGDPVVSFNVYRTAKFDSSIRILVVSTTQVMIYQPRPSKMDWDGVVVFKLDRLVGTHVSLEGQEVCISVSS